MKGQGSFDRASNMFSIQFVRDRAMNLSVLSINLVSFNDLVVICQR